MLKLFCVVSPHYAEDVGAISTRFLYSYGYKEVQVFEREIVMDERAILGVPQLRFAVVNAKSNIVLSLHRTVNGANVEAADYNKSLSFDGSDLFEVVELSGKVDYVA